MHTGALEENLTANGHLRRKYSWNAGGGDANADAGTTTVPMVSAC